MRQKYLTRIILFILISFLLTINCKAQLTINSEIRPRFEFRDGYKKLASSGVVPSFLVSQRTRLSFNYTSDKIKFTFTPQDVRIWGNERLSSSTGIYGDDASLDIFEDFAEIKLGKKCWVSVGRQQLVYDYERLLSARNWNQNGIAYDAVLLKTVFKQWNIHLAGSWNSLSETSSNNLYLSDRLKSLNFIWVNKKFNEKQNVSILHIASGVTETDSTNTLFFRQTSGIYTDFQGEKIKYRANAYYQYEKNKIGQNISAFLIDIDGSYKILKLTPGLGVSYLSGNKNIVDKTDRLFDVLYGSRHRYFGSMDYFSSFASETKSGGLADYYAYFTYKFSKLTSITYTGHSFQLAEINSNTPRNKKLGFENDLLVKYKFSEWGLLKGGYMFFLPTESLKTLQGVPNEKFSQFIYLELTLTPTLFVQQ